MPSLLRGTTSCSDCAFPALLLNRPLLEGFFHGVAYGELCAKSNSKVISPEKALAFALMTGRAGISPQCGLPLRPGAVCPITIGCRSFPTSSFGARGSRAKLADPRTFVATCLQEANMAKSNRDYEREISRSEMIDIWLRVANSDQTAFALMAHWHQRYPSLKAEFKSFMNVGFVRGERQAAKAKANAVAVRPAKPARPAMPPKAPLRKAPKAKTTTSPWSRLTQMASGTRPVQGGLPSLGKRR